MSDYAVVQLEEIGEMNDGRCPWRPVAAQLGITAFGANAWTAREAGDRIRPRARAARGASRERRALLQRRLLRDPRRPHCRRARAPPARDRAVRSLPRPREG